MYNTINEAIAALRTTPTTLPAILRNLSQDEAQIRRDGEKEWSILEVVCHLRDTEEVVLQRVRTFRDAAEPVVAGFDADQLARERNYSADNLRSALTAFLELRNAHIADLEALNPAQWERVGRHTVNGPITILNHTLHSVWHDADHLAQVARQLR